VDSSGNLSASGSITAFGGLSLVGNYLPAADNLYDVGSSSTQWRYGNFQGGLLVADGTTTSTLLNNAFTFGQTSGSNLGKFYLDSSGNASTSGTLTVFGSQTASSSLLSSNLLRLGVGSGYNMGMFNVDSNGNLSASGTLNLGAYATSSLPTAGVPGRLARATNDSRGLWMDQGSQWFATNNEIFNVKEFGAKGDGATDDYTAITNALAAAAAKGGGIVYMPPGTYYVSTTITWPQASNISLTGAGRGITTFYSGVNSSTLNNNNYIAINFSFNSPQFNTRISNMTIRGTDVSVQPAYELITVSGGTMNASDMYFENLELKWSMHSGLRFIYSSNDNSAGLYIRNNYFHDIASSTAVPPIEGGAILGNINRYTQITDNLFYNVGNLAGFHAVYIANGKDIVIANNIFDGQFSDLNMTEGAGTVLNNVSVTGNVFRDQNQNRIGVYGAMITGNSYYNTTVTVFADRTNFSNNNMFASSTDGNPFIQYQSNPSDILISNNLFYLEDTPIYTNTGVYVDGTGNRTKISNNYFYNVTYPVRLDGGNNHVVTDNQIIRTKSSDYAYGIWIVEGTGHLIKDNYIRIESGSQYPFYAGIWDESTSGVGSSTIVGNIIEGSVLNTGITNTTYAPVYNYSYVTSTPAGKVGLGGIKDPLSLLSLRNGNMSIFNDSVTSTFGANFLSIASSTTNMAGLFYIDSSGNTNVSGTLRVYGGASTGGLLISATNTTTTLTSYVSGSGVGAFVLDTNTLFAPASSTVLLSVRNAGNRVFSISNDGYVASTGTFNANVASTGIGDVAEYVNLSFGESAEPGDVLIVDPLNPNKYKKSDTAYAKTVSGAVSDTGAFIIGASGYSRVPLALAGLVKIKVTNEAGSIQIGDYLVTASKPGHAMKYNADNPQPAALIGMALESLIDGEGKITVLISKGLVSGTATLTVSSSNNGQLTPNQPLDLNGLSIINISYIKAKNSTWQIDEAGNLVQRLKTERGDKNVYNLASNEKENLVLSGAAQLEGGQKQITFD
jgi:hypothetical protein